MDKDIAALVNLPWATLLALASGYAGYFVANTGLRSHHKAIDIAFSTIVFGFLGAFAFEYMLRSNHPILESSAVGFVAASICGAFWRKIGRAVLSTTLRTSNISYADDLPDAWRQIFTVTDANITQLSIKLKDGSWLHCEDLNRFKNDQGGPCTLGESGDILMFATHQKSAGEDSFTELADVQNTWGVQTTYIPRDNVALVDLRVKKRS